MVEGPNAAAEAARLIDEGDRSSALVIPADFSERIASGGRGKLVFHRNPGRTNPQATRATLDRVLARMNIELTAVDAAVAAHSELWGEPSPTAEGRISSRLEGTLAQAWAEPHLSVQFERLGRPTGSDVPEMGFQHSSPAITLMYVLLNGLMLSVVLVEERRLRTLSRLFTAPVRRSQLIAANLIWRFVVAALQSTILVVIGSVAFRVDWGDSALALAAVLAAFAASVAGLSVLIGSLARTTRQAHSAALVVSLSMSAIGGLWWPLEVTPETYQTVGHLAPTAWAMDALHDLVSRGDVLAGVLPEVWVLLGFAAVFSVAATLAFRPE